MNLQWIRRALLPLLLLLACGAASAQVTGRNFDHLTTGFELTGAHRLQACESCHVDAVFAGTPRVCAACHAQGSRIGATPKPSTHVASTDVCGACHTTSAWIPASRFDHDGGPRRLRDLPQRPAGTGQARLARRDEPGLRRLPRQDRLESREVRPLRRHRQLRLLPRRRQGDRQDGDALPDDEQLRVLPHDRRLGSRHPHGSHAGQRHVRVVPRRQVGNRQACIACADHGRVRHLPRNRGVEAGELHPRRHRRRLRQLP